MTDADIIDLIKTIQSMEERGIFVKDYDIMDAVELVKFNRIVDNDIVMNELLER